MEEEKLSVYETDRSGGDGRGAGSVKSQDMELMQQRLFETLSCFADFCEAHGLTYILAGGTCIGAVREHDFVAWDGDLDVAMLRKDFNRLFELWEKEGDKENFSLYQTTEDFCAYVPVGIMRNNNTTFIRVFEEGLEDRNLGVKIDIEPMDEIPADRLKRRIQKAFARVYVALMTQRIPRRKSKSVTFGVRALLAVVRSRGLRNRILRIARRQITKYNGTGCSMVAINGLGRESRMTDLTETVLIPFHGRECRVPANYDEYLRTKYGDYMKKPPLEIRRFGDNPVYYDLNMPFREYLAAKKQDQRS